ncbi:MAG: hypothetical protein E6J72_08720 [Deltaproteobacteria bacterium]|nr:MAG: hypothetical protein E6J72_08720 [Deltaproteobacteria bacterium]
MSTTISPRSFRTIATAALALVVSVASAQQMFIYPKNGQSKDQQAKDQTACADWAKSQSGVDPSAPPPPPDMKGRRRGTAGGAARGAATGAAVGAIAGDAGKGAAAGAAVGGVAGRRHAKQQEQAAQASNRNAFDRAVAACMESRGYTVR